MTAQHLDDSCHGNILLFHLPRIILSESLQTHEKLDQRSDVAKMVSMIRQKKNYSSSIN